MKKTIALAIVLALGTGMVYADEQRADEKKSAKAKANAKKKESKEKEKPAAKSDKNAAQKAEASIGQWAHENKIWVRGASKK